MAHAAPEARTAVLERLRREVTDNPKPQPGSPSRLHHGQVDLEPVVFQPRMFRGTIGLSEAHIEVMMHAIRHAPGNLIDPVEVWWTGKRWVIVDGHHRLLAYQRLASIPSKKRIDAEMNVMVFEGSLGQAMCRSAATNSKDKLPMQSADKTEVAWRLVCMDESSIKEIAESAETAKRTISYMRDVLKNLKVRITTQLETDLWDSDVTEDWIDDPINLTWKQARDIAKGGSYTEVDDDWKRQLVD